MEDTREWIDRLDSPRLLVHRPLRGGVAACGTRAGDHRGQADTELPAVNNQAVARVQDRPLIVGVTILTSMDDSDLAQIGIHAPLHKQVQALASLAKSSGLDGIVCSAHEIEMVKSTCGNDFYTVVPGIRPENSHNNDQKRVTTPKKAITNGADFLVIGRPITLSESPKRAAKGIAESLN